MGVLVSHEVLPEGGLRLTFAGRRTVEVSATMLLSLATARGKAQALLDTRQTLASELGYVLDAIELDWDATGRVVKFVLRHHGG